MSFAWALLFSMRFFTVCSSSVTRVAVRVCPCNFNFSSSSSTSVLSLELSHRILVLRLGHDRHGLGSSLLLRFSYILRVPAGPALYEDSQLSG